jgi:hypothetical protein
LALRDAMTSMSHEYLIHNVARLQFYLLKQKCPMASAGGNVSWMSKMCPLSKGTGSGPRRKVGKGRGQKWKRIWFFIFSEFKNHQWHPRLLMFRNGYSAPITG